MLRAVSAGTLNNLAFAAKKKAFHEIDKGMIVRNQRFVEGSLRVEKANPTLEMKNQKAQSGSIKRPRFSGWVEQEGAASHMHRAAQVASRVGESRQGQVAGKNRFKNFLKWGKPDGFSDTQISQFLGERSAGKDWKVPFLMPRRYKRMSKGLYVFGKSQGKIVVNGKRVKRRKIIRLWRYQASPLKIRPDHWLTRTGQFVSKDHRYSTVAFGMAVRNYMKQGFKSG